MPRSAAEMVAPADSRVDRRQRARTPVSVAARPVQEPRPAFAFATGVSWAIIGGRTAAHRRRPVRPQRRRA